MAEVTGVASASSDREEAQAGAGLIETVLEFMPDAALVVSDTGTIIAANDQLALLFGYGAAELANRPVELLVPERFRSAHRRHRADYGEAPQARAMGAGLELTGRRRDGTEIPIDISLAPFASQDGGLVVAAVRDVTERRAATAAHAQLASIVESSADGIISIAVEGDVTSWNAGAARMFGYSADQMHGRHVSVLIPDDASAEVEELLDGAVEGRPSPPKDTQWLRSDGARLDVAVSVSAMHDPAGYLLGFSVLVRDITQRKRTELALADARAQERRRERQQAAMSEIRLAVLSETPLPEVLELICAHTADLLASESSGLVMRPNDSGDGDRLEVVAAAGDAQDLVGRSLNAKSSLAGRIIHLGAMVHVPALSSDADLDMSPMMPIPLGPGLGAPVVFETEICGALTVSRGDGAADFTPLDEELIISLAHQTSLALELANARADREQLLLAADRERVARDLHDVVIQRLFASGMSLQGVINMVSDERVVDRLMTVVDGLDTTIREVRSTIFDLMPPAVAASGVRAQVLVVAREATSSLGFDPTVRFDGPVDAGVPDHVVPHVVAVLREALSNAARHAEASRVSVEVTVADNLVLTVTDNGKGLGPSTRRSGLANMRRRAEQLDGTFVVEPGDEGGTRLAWQVPVR